MIRFAIFAIIAASFLVPGTTAHAAQTRQLSLEDRIHAQEALERVYYSHQIGATRPFEEAVPREVLERKVRTYLKQSVALERFWNTPVTARMLQLESERMAQGTRMPERLAELYAALGDDPVLILECLARASLVDRLSRNFYMFDARIHGEARESAETLRRQLATGELDPSSWDPRRTVVEVARDAGGENSAAPSMPPDPAGRRPDDPVRETLSSELFDRRADQLPAEPGGVGPVAEEADAFQVWVVLEREPDRLRAVSYRVAKQPWDGWWASAESGFDEDEAPAVARDESVLAPEPTGLARQAGIGAALLSTCAPNDTWDNGVLDDIPVGREGHSAVWTGSYMIAWGGRDPSTSFDTGGRYDPATDTWTPTSTQDAPSARSRHTAVWTGTEMIVWGGCQNPACSPELVTGGRYDPATDTWTPTSTTNAPPGRRFHTAVWTGTVMVVWGGFDGVTDLDSGGRYNPATDTWWRTSFVNAPSGRSFHTAVWTGNLMVVWGGWDGDPFLDTGGRYDAFTDTWVPTSSANAPPGRRLHTAVWTGSQMIVWGGVISSYSDRLTGGRYDPVTDTWTPTSTTNTPSSRTQHRTVWTGSLMVVWGGNGVDTGGRYDPATDTWTPTSTTNAPGPRESFTAVWTGDLMIVWGGFADGIFLNTGGRYEPATDAWTPTSSSRYGPSARSSHTAVWTGTEMIVWGGYTVGATDTGGRYDPAIDIWTPTSTTNAPEPRYGHTAVWAGGEIIVWGGSGGAAGTYVDTGGRYDPVTDAWTPTFTAHAPAPRTSHIAVWTGTEMIVWGGYDGAELDTGSLYDPDRDKWTSMSKTNAPSARYWHSAVWTGGQMIVWGGNTDTGGRYDPATDAWTSTSTTNAPSARRGHTAVWTGGRMIVWGGVAAAGPYVDTGGRYDPVTDTWSPTSTANAPPARFRHTAVWTGSLMIVWGGTTGAYLDTGGRYDPVTDTWSPTSTANAPPARYSHTAVWTEGLMIVWGGTIEYPLNSGGRYVLLPDDGDGFNACGDCDDADPATYPSAPHPCDGRNNACDMPGWPSLAGTNEADDDLDGLSECQGDCDDSDMSVWATPGEALTLELTHDISTGTTTLTWSPPLALGGVSVLHDVIRTGDPADFMGGGMCTQADGPTTISTDSSVPSPEGIYYYLVRAENACPASLGVGPLGFGSDGTPIDGRSCP